MKIEEYKTTILSVLSRGIAVRRRELAWHCGCWVANSELGKALAELEAMGRIGERTHSDPANMNTYIEYYLL